MDLRYIYYEINVFLYKPLISLNPSNAPGWIQHYHTTNSWNEEKTNTASKHVSLIFLIHDQYFIWAKLLEFNVK